MDEPLTPISPEIREQIDAIRNDAAHPYNNPMHRDHEAAQAKMESLYRASTNETAIADEAATLAAPPAPPPRLDLPPAPEGRSYDAPTVTEFVDMVASQGIDEATVNQWIVKGHERLAQGGALPPAAADVVLRERFGERLPAVTAVLVRQLVPRGDSGEGCGLARRDRDGSRGAARICGRGSVAL